MKGRRRSLPKNETPSSSPGPEFWMDVERRGPGILRYISPLRMRGTPRSNKLTTRSWQEDPHKESAKTCWKNTTDKPTPFTWRDLQPVTGNKSTLKKDNSATFGQDVQQTQGMRLCSKRKRRRKRRKRKRDIHTAENKRNASDLRQESDKQETKNESLGNRCIASRHYERKSVVQGKNVVASDSQRYCADPHRQSPSITCKKAVAEGKSLEVSGSHYSKTEQQESSQRQSAERLQAVTGAWALEGSIPQMCNRGKPKGFPSARTRIARFEAKRLERIRKRKRSCESLRIVVGHGQPLPQEAGHYNIPSAQLVTSTLKEDADYPTPDSVDPLMPLHNQHVASPLTRVCGVKEWISTFEAKQRNSIQDRRSSSKTINHQSCNQSETFTQPDSQSAALTGQETVSIPAPSLDAQDATSVIRHPEVNPDPVEAFISPQFHGVQTSITALLPPNCNSEPKQKRLKSALDQEAISSGDVSQQRTPVSGACNAASSITHPDMCKCNGPILCNTTPSGDKHTNGTLMTNGQQSCCKASVSHLSAAESLCCPASHRVMHRYKSICKTPPSVRRNALVSPLEFGHDASPLQWALPITSHFWSLTGQPSQKEWHEARKTREGAVSLTNRMYQQNGQHFKFPLVNNSELRTDLDKGVFASPLIKSTQGASVTKCTQLLRRSLQKRRRNNHGSCPESGKWTDTSSACSLSSSDVVSGVMAPGQSSVVKIAKHPPPVEFENNTDNNKSSAKAKRARPVHRAPHRRRSGTPVSSSESEKYTDRDLFKVSSEAGTSVQQQPASALPVPKTLSPPSPFGFIRLISNRDRRFERRKEPDRMQRLFSSSDETDPSIATARAASLDFLQKDWDKDVDEDCCSDGADGSGLGNQGCITDDDAVDEPDGGRFINNPESSDDGEKNDQDSDHNDWSSEEEDVGRDDESTARHYSNNLKAVGSSDTGAEGNNGHLGEAGDDGANSLDFDVCDCLSDDGITSRDDGDGSENGKLSDSGHESDGNVRSSEMDENGSWVYSLVDQKNGSNTAKHMSVSCSKEEQQNSRDADVNNENLGACVHGCEQDLESDIINVEDDEEESVIEDTCNVGSPLPQTPVCSLRLRKARQSQDGLSRTKTRVSSQKTVITDVGKFKEQEKVVKKLAKRSHASKHEKSRQVSACHGSDDRLLRINTKTSRQAKQTTGEKKNETDQSIAATPQNSKQIPANTNPSEVTPLHYICHRDGLIRHRRKLRWPGPRPQRAKKTGLLTGLKGKQKTSSAKQESAPKGSANSALLRTNSQAVNSVALQEILAKRTEANRAVSQSMVSSFPVDWEEPVKHSRLLNEHRQFLQDRFLKLLMKRGKEMRLTNRPSLLDLTLKDQLKEQRREREQDRKWRRKLTADIKSDKWINYETLPQVFTVQKTKEFHPKDPTEMRTEYAV
ncbi:uncharacterized protein LOC110980713 [Acanthaster planci]|uniref:Uncharacterized protein LOC110980713 n=1 Tax=Acanthaster planci TaxID=133434 RepID=A0A8B7YJ91_ACAPL|nr:uncharacterized protein LOC110980713 [Acanthaster planci]XP_022093320.1 uncharacterized protein LOC110980713 [Acanthaster planci]